MRKQFDMTLVEKVIDIENEMDIRDSNFAIVKFTNGLIISLNDLSIQRTLTQMYNDDIPRILPFLSKKARQRILMNCSRRAAIMFAEEVLDRGENALEEAIPSFVRMLNIMLMQVRRDEGVIRDKNDILVSIHKLMLLL